VYVPDRLFQDAFRSYRCALITGLFGRIVGGTILESIPNDMQPNPLQLHHLVLLHGPKWSASVSITNLRFQLPSLALALVYREKNHDDRPPQPGKLPRSELETPHLHLTMYGTTLAEQEALPSTWNS